jgi:SSS family solute:Na+ symporter
MGFHRFDLAIIAVYLLAITLFGMSFRGGRQSLKDYFLGGRVIPWWAISLSIVAAETSVLTIISTPGLSFAGNFEFLQLVFGYLLARIVIVVILIPQYFRGELFTAYQLMQRRFGTRVKTMTALIFLVGRGLAEGVRVFAIAIVLGAVVEALPRLGINLHLGAMQIIGAIALLTLAYTFEGGMKAVVWTDFIQICLYMAGAVLSVVLLLRLVPGGWHAVRVVAGAQDKFRVFDFRFSWFKPYTFWSGLIGGTFLTTATHGTDQLLVQRLLSARSERESKLALLSSWAVIFIQFTIFLVIGVLLFVIHHGIVPQVAGAFGRYDRLYPEFIIQYFPTGLSGLSIAAIIAAAMSNLSAALNSLTSTTMMDFYRPHLAPGRSERHYLWVSRLATVGWTVALSIVAYASRHSTSVLQAGLTIVSFPFSGLLGVFLLGTLTRRANETGAMTGIVLGVGTTVVLWYKGIPFTWFVVAGTLVTFFSGYLVSLATPPGNAAPRAAGSDGIGA